MFPPCLANRSKQSKIADLRFHFAGERYPRALI
jgi:hypothetical protein